MSMSTSQLISLGIFLFSAGALGRSYIKKNVKGVLALFSLLLLVGCLPSPPDYRYVSKFKILSEEGIFLYDMNNKLIVDEGELVDTNPNRNLIFVAIDDSVAPQFQPQINKLYKKNGQEAGPRAEDIAWWQLSKKIKTVYDKVIYITFDNFNRDSLKEAIVQAERLGKPYDLYLLTHGIPNHIKASAGEEFISYKDIAKLSGVVTRICGGFFSILAFSACVVSPVLTPTLMSKSFPSFLAISIISFKGSFKFTEISLESAFNGEIYMQ